MLTVEENERITRVGTGTPMGKYLRRFWWPLCLSTELPERDGAPLRVRMLGEDLIAFRDTDGNVGLVDAYCPHRRAPLFFGRNEECGLRCVYHGWKFDRHGDCVDMPSEPAGTTLQAKVKILAYPTVEKGGVIWTYMGPKESQPEPPDYEWTRAPATHRYVSKTFENCNWLQALEGGLDTAHSSFAHNNKLGDRANLRQHDRAPLLDVERTDYGYYYVSTRNVDTGKYYRVYHYVMPAQQLRASIIGYEGVRNKPARLDGHIWAPIDDFTTHVYNIMCAPHPEDELTPQAVEAREKAAGRGKDDSVPGHLPSETQPGERLHDRPPDAEDAELHRHRRRQHAGLRAAGRHGPDLRPLEGIPRHLRQGDRRVAPAAARCGRDQREGRHLARPRSQDLSQPFAPMTAS